MSMRSFMSRCTTDILLNREDGGEPASFIPDGQTSGKDCTVVMGTARHAVITNGSGPNQQRFATAVGSRSTLREAIRIVTGIARDPDSRDAIAFASGPYEGEWIIEGADADVDDSIAMDLRWERPYAFSAEGVRL
jgi:hypothetical protein